MNKKEILIKIFIVLIFALNICTSYASVNNILKPDVIDSNYVNLLNKKASEYIKSNIDSGIFYAQLAIHYGNLIDYQEGICLGYVNKATGCWIKTQYDSALTLYQKSLEIAKKIDFSDCFIKSTNGIANVYYQYGNHAKALEYYLISLRTAEKNSNRRGESVALNNIGIMYSEQKEYQKALGFLNRSKEISHGILDTHLYMMTLNYIGTVHYNLKNYKESITKHYESLEYFKTHEVNQRIAESYNYLANNYYKLEDFERAEEYYQMALTYALKSKGTEHQCYAILGISNLYVIKKQYNKALQWANRGFQLAKTAKHGTLLRDYYQLLSEIYEKLGNTQLAFKNYKEFFKQSENINNHESEIKSAFLYAQYEFEKKEEQYKSEQNIKNLIQKQEISNWRFAFFIGLIILIFSFALTIFMNKSKRKLKNTNSQLKIAYNEIDKHRTELIELNGSKDKFFSIIAHDLQSPFNTIVGFSEILIDQISNKNYDKISLYGKTILDSSNRAVNLLTNLMEWAQSQTGRMIFNPEHFDLVKLVNHNILLFKEIAGQKIITLKADMPSNVYVFGDKAMISTVLRNLISNAIKFSKKGNDITISVNINNSNLIISVNDNGVGISNERVQKLFRIDSSESTYGTDNEKGTGLGLILCKEFIDKHQGEIWVISEECVGSTFSFSLPYDPDVVFETNIEQPTSYERSNVIGNLAILVVEDEEISEYLIDNYISMYGKEVLKAKTGFEAIEICINNPNIDLILMDIRMKNIDGYEATSIIREFNKDVVIIAQTAYGLKGDKEKALNAGCNDYISKPIKKAEFQAMIQKYFREE
jgi:signal transduction histidine kinase/CheY-like chemotaxis protein